MNVTAIHFCFRRRSKIILFIRNNDDITMEIADCYSTFENLQYVYYYDRITTMFIHQPYNTFKKNKHLLILYKLSIFLTIPLNTTLVQTIPIWRNKFLHTNKITKLIINNTQIYPQPYISGYNKNDLTVIKCYTIPIILKCIIDYIEEEVEKFEYRLEKITRNLEYQKGLVIFFTHLEITKRYPTDFAECLSSFL